MLARQPLAQLLQRLAAELWSASAPAASAAEQAVTANLGTATSVYLRQLHAAADAMAAGPAAVSSAAARREGASAVALHLHAALRGLRESSPPPPLPSGVLRRLHTGVPASTKQKLKAKAVLVDGKPARKPRSPRKTQGAAAETADVAETPAKRRRGTKRPAAGGAAADSTGADTRTMKQPAEGSTQAKQPRSAKESAVQPVTTSGSQPETILAEQMGTELQLPQPAALKAKSVDRADPSAAAAHAGTQAADAAPASAQPADQQVNDRACRFVTVAG